MKAAEMKSLYLDWISNNEDYKDLSDRLVQIDTPFLDGSFDNIIIYAETINNNKIKLTDDGWTIDYLESHGVSFKHGSYRYEILHSLLDTHGLEIRDDEIMINCNPSRFAISKQRLVQGLIKINDLVFLNKSTVASTFKDDVIKRLQKNDILYDSPYRVTGKNGYTYSFDISIPKHGGQKKLVNTITQPNRIDFSKVFVVDAKLSSLVEPNATFFAVLNDEKELTNLSEIKDLFENESEVPITPVLMSEKEEFINKLSN